MVFWDPSRNGHLQISLNTGGCSTQDRGARRGIGHGTLRSHNVNRCGREVIQSASGCPAMDNAMRWHSQVRDGQPVAGSTSAARQEQEAEIGPSDGTGKAKPSGKSSSQLFVYVLVRRGYSHCRLCSAGCGERGERGLPLIGIQRTTKLFEMSTGNIRRKRNEYPATGLVCQKADKCCV